jgi:hypothetical protein
MKSIIQFAIWSCSAEYMFNPVTAWMRALILAMKGVWSSGSHTFSLRVPCEGVFVHNTVLQHEPDAEVCWSKVGAVEGQCAGKHGASSVNELIALLLSHKSAEHTQVHRRVWHQVFDSLRGMNVSGIEARQNKKRMALRSST